MNYYVPERDSNGSLIIICNALISNNYDSNQLNNNNEYSKKIEQKKTIIDNSIQQSNSIIPKNIVSPIIKFNDNNNNNYYSIPISPILLPSFNQNQNDIMINKNNANSIQNYLNESLGDEYNKNYNNSIQYSYSPLPIIENTTDDLDIFNMSIISDKQINNENNNTQYTNNNESNESLSFANSTNNSSFNTFFNYLIYKRDQFAQNCTDINGPITFLCHVSMLH
ncbi:hypothetical protein WA158_005826 [Blastocystis sp. Blastoise]